MRIIKVVDYDKEWEQHFSLEKILLEGVLLDLSPLIHHIGSTSIKGMRAKPTIDILIELAKIDEIDQFDTELEKIGYEAKGEFGIKGRRYFQKGGDDRSHHVHAFTKGTDNVIRHIAFRDYLLTHPDVAIKYAALKTKIAAKCDNDIQQYCAGKNAFVQHHEALAIEWYALNKSMKNKQAR